MQDFNDITLDAVIYPVWVAHKRHGTHARPIVNRASIARPSLYLCDNVANAILKGIYEMGVVLSGIGQNFIEIGECRFGEYDLHLRR